MRKRSFWIRRNTADSCKSNISLERFCEWMFRGYCVFEPTSPIVGNCFVVTAFHKLKWVYVCGFQHISHVIKGWCEDWLILVLKNVVCIKVKVENVKQGTEVTGLQFILFVQFNWGATVLYPPQKIHQFETNVNRFLNGFFSPCLSSYVYKHFHIDF